MSSAPRPQGCPSSDELSASIDGFTPEEIAVHLDSCSACQRQLSLLRRIDGAVRQSLTPPTGLSERVRAAVRNSAQQEEPILVEHWWFSPVLRLAAAVVATAAALAVLVHVLGGQARPDGRSGNAVIAGPDQVPAVTQPADPATAEPPLGPDNTKLAGVNRGAAPAASADGGAPQALPDDIRHVWTVANVDGESRRIKGMVAPAACRFSKEGGNTVVSVDLKDEALQRLVDQLHEQKWQLVTPELPQPQQRSTVAFSGRNVHYRMVLVEQR